jgi:hypothetical protein
MTQERIFLDLLLEYTKAGRTPVGKWYFIAYPNPNPPKNARTVQDLLVFELKDDG